MKWKWPQISLIRGLRFVLGLFFILAAVDEKEWALGVLGAVFLIQSIFNWGCGVGDSSCDVQTINKTK